MMQPHHLLLTLTLTLTLFHASPITTARVPVKVSMMSGVGREEGRRNENRYGTVAGALTAVDYFTSREDRVIDVSIELIRPRVEVAGELFRAAQHVQADGGCNPDANDVLARPELPVELIGPSSLGNALPTSALIGPAMSSGTVPVQDVLRFSGLPHTTTGASSDDLSDKSMYPTYFRAFPSSASSITALVAFFESQGWSHVAAIYSRDSFGSRTIKALEAATQTANVTISTRIVMDVASGVISSEENVRDSFQQIVDTGVRVIALLVSPTSMPVVLNFAQELGIIRRGYVFAGVYGVTPQTISEAPLGSAGLIAAMPRSHPTTPYFQQFAARYESFVRNSTLMPSWMINATDPLPFSLQGYEAALFLLKALNATVAAGLDPRNRTVVMEQLRQQKITNAFGRMLELSDTLELSERIEIHQATATGDIRLVSSYYPNAPVGSRVVQHDSLQMPGNISVLPVGFVPDTCASSDQYRNADGTCVMCPKGYRNVRGDDKDECIERGVTTKIDTDLLVMVVGAAVALIIAVWLYAYIRHLQFAKQATVRQAEAETAYTNFIFHEVRNPLHAAMSYIEFMISGGKPSADPDPSLDGAEAESLQDDLYNAKIAMDHAMEVLNNVLDLSKTAAGKLRIEAEPMNLYDVVSSAARMMHSINSEVELICTLDVDPNLVLPRGDVPEHQGSQSRSNPSAIVESTLSTSRGLVVMGDAQRLRQILINFISNALKFTRAGFVLVHVNVRPAADDTRMSYSNKSARVLPSPIPSTHSPTSIEIDFTVADSGNGITPAQQARLFNKYEHAQAHTGTGLGLVLSKIFVELMSTGTIQVQSPWRRTARERELCRGFDPSGGKHPGAKFFFTIQSEIVPDSHPAPLSHHANTLSRQPTPTLLADSAPSTQPPAVEMAVLDEEVTRILVVDDVAVNRRIMARKFKTKPFPDHMNVEVDMARNGEEALQLIRDQGNHYDVVVLDQLMTLSGGTLLGTETAVLIRQWQLEQNLPPSLLIACSGCASQSDIDAFVSSGMDLVWTKPVPPIQQLYEQVARALGYNAMHSAPQSIASSCTHS